MIKKVLLIAAALILAISCSKNNPTTPTNNGDTGIGNTGGGSIIEEGTGTSSPTTIADFLKKHEGRYYSEEFSEQYGITTRYIYYRIESGKIYEEESKTEIQGNKTISGNKLQIEIQGNQSSQYGSDWNPHIEILNFSDNSIQEFYKMVFTKENFTTLSGYDIVTTISQAGKYAGNYYVYGGDTDTEITKEYLFTIDDKGNIYSVKDYVSKIRCSLNGNVLTLEFPEAKYNFIIEANRAIASILINNIEQTSTMRKSDLLTPYAGTYSEGSITLTVDEANAVITPADLMNPSAILNGNNLTIYDHRYIDNTAKVEEHKIVFNGDGTATYTKPNGVDTVTLKKN